MHICQHSLYRNPLFFINASLWNDAVFRIFITSVLVILVFHQIRQRIVHCENEDESSHLIKTLLSHLVATFWRIERLFIWNGWLVFIFSCFLLGLALNYIFENSFKPEAGARTGVSKIGILITDGKSQDDIIPPSRNLRESGVELFAIGTC